MINETDQVLGLADQYAKEMKKTIARDFYYELADEMNARAVALEEET